MEIKMMKGQPSKLVRVTLDVTFNDLVKVEKFCPAKLTFVDPESKKVTYRVDLTEKGLHTAALGVADAAAAPTEKVCLNFVTSYDKEDLGAIITKLASIEDAVKAAKAVVEEAATRIVEEE